MDVGLLVPAAAVAVALGLGGYALRAERERLRGLHALARRNGWGLTRRDDDWARAFEGEPFGRGSGRRAETVLTGTHGGRDLVAFDYSFRTRSTDGQGRTTTTVHRYAVAALRLPVPVPRVEVEAAGWVPRFLDRGLELESEAFNERYRVHADDARLAYDLLPARTMQLLLDRPDVAVRLLGGTAVCWQRGRLDADELQVRLDTVTAVLDGVPAWVWADRA